jgi:hypothetical protein
MELRISWQACLISSSIWYRAREVVFSVCSCQFWLGGSAVVFEFSEVFKLSGDLLGRLHAKLYKSGVWPSLLRPTLLFTSDAKLSI